MSALAINGGTPIRTVPFPKWPIWDEREERALLDVLHSGLWGVSGREDTQVRAFENTFAAAHDAHHGVCVTSGSTALKVALQAIDIDYGDEVIVPPYTFIATASTCLHVGAMPVFADIDPASYLLDPQRVEEAITPRTRAIMPVHIGGCPADMDGILSVAKRHGLRVIEDACQAHFAAYDGRGVGAIGDLGCFSFQSSKNITAGEGGIILSNDAELAERCWSISNCGRVRGGEWYQHDVLGDNFRMTEWQGAILLAQSTRMEEMAQRREDNAHYLGGLLAQIEGIAPQQPHPKVTRHAYHLFISRYDPAGFGGAPRSKFLKAVQAEGIPCSGGYVPLYTAHAMQDGIRRLRRWLEGRDTPYTPPSCPVTDRACYDEGLWLSQSILLGTHADMDDIAEAMAKVQRHTDDLLHN
ncbi:MAG: DegT/DnrJ/EryC1/StrS family aminotransferase [Anaerolineales bacterium]|nr:DegT/DnrJ/EryC1/StrS family aminotransferase [Anaerolineales bacterium]